MTGAKECLRGRDPFRLTALLGEAGQAGDDEAIPTARFSPGC